MFNIVDKNKYNISTLIYGVQALQRNCLLLVCGQIRGTQQSCVVTELHVSTVCKVRNDVPIWYLNKDWIGDKSKTCLTLCASTSITELPVVSRTELLF